MAGGKLILRRFQYLDGTLVRQYLAQVPGGVEIQTKGTRETKGQTSVGGVLGYGPVSAKAGKDKGSTETTQFEIERSAPADFNTLHSLAAEQGLIQSLDAIDDGIWNQLEVGELIEARVVLALPKIHELLAAADTYKELVGVMRAMGQEPQPDHVRALAIFDVIAPVLKNENPTLIGSLAGSPRFRLAIPLIPSNLLVDVASTRGEATVLAAVERKTTRGGFLTIADMVQNVQAFLPNRATRRRKQAASTSPEQDQFLDEQELRIAHPAALVTPVAIYR